MKLPRRQLLRLAAGGAALPTVSRVAWSQSYPARPVRIVLGLAPGGSVDIVARLIGQWLSERLSQPFIIENRPGAGTNIGTEAVVRAPANGYTLLYVTTANASNATLFDKLNFNFRRDIAPVAGIIRVPNLVSVNLSLPVTTIPTACCLRQSQSRKAELWRTERRHRPTVRRTVQDDVWR